MASSPHPAGFPELQVVRKDDASQPLTLSRVICHPATILLAATFPLWAPLLFLITLASGALLFPLVLVAGPFLALHNALALWEGASSCRHRVRKPTIGQ